MSEQSDIDAHNALASQQSFYAGALKRSMEECKQLQDALGQTRASLGTVSMEAMALKELNATRDTEQKQALTRSLEREEKWRTAYEKGLSGAVAQLALYKSALADIVETVVQYNGLGSTEAEQIARRIMDITYRLKEVDSVASEGG